MPLVVLFQVSLLLSLKIITLNTIELLQWARSRPPIEFSARLLFEGVASENAKKQYETQGFYRLQDTKQGR